MRGETQGNPARNTAQSCTATEHVCAALALAFFAIMATGETGVLTLAAVKACGAAK
jgi:hypothetical protein